MDKQTTIYTVLYFIDQTSKPLLIGTFTSYNSAELSSRLYLGKKLPSNEHRIEIVETLLNEINPTNILTYNEEEFNIEIFTIVSAYVPPPGYEPVAITIPSV